MHKGCIGENRPALVWNSPDTAGWDPTMHILPIIKFPHYKPCTHLCQQRTGGGKGHASCLASEQSNIGPLGPVVLHEHIDEIFWSQPQPLHKGQCSKRPERYWKMLARHVARWASNCFLKASREQSLEDWALQPEAQSTCSQAPQCPASACWRCSASFPAQICTVTVQQSAHKPGLLWAPALNLFLLNAKVCWHRTCSALRRSLRQLRWLGWHRWHCHWR